MIKLKLYTPDTMLNLKAKLSKEELLKTMKGHMLAEAQFMADIRGSAGRTT
jgi:phosphatidylethanolamine-binding protein (PEBP) family uncharacterized protein